ncbi:MAG TPA: hypothetical protein GX708_01865 [Gallicola sp.]|nr:hypothetical protein [Gallicola sp.]
MSKEQLQKEIISKEGIILSEGTHNLTHLLTSAYDLITNYNLEEDAKAAKIITDIRKCFVNTNQENKDENLPTYYNQYYNYICIPDENQEEASILFNEDIFNYFSEISPEGYYFSSHPGDGSLFGWWKCEDKEF